MFYFNIIIKHASFNIWKSCSPLYLTTYRYVYIPIDHPAGDKEVRGGVLGPRGLTHGPLTEHSLSIHDD